MTTIEQLRLDAKRDRERFISSRAVVENSFKKFGEGLKLVDPKLLKGINVPEEFTAQALLPSLYIEPFNKDNYTAEAKALIVTLEAIDNVRKALIEEARRLIYGDQKSS